MQPASPAAPAPETLQPTTEEDYPRFRILIVGQSAAGKRSLINVIFKASLNFGHDRAGAVNINEAITSPHNKHLILHDYEPGDKDKFDILEKFITEKQSSAERLHAIWLCVPAPHSGERFFETAQANVFKSSRNRVPIIVVITKFDLYVAELSKQGNLKGQNISWQAAEEMFKQTFGHKFEKAGMSQDRPVPYALVSSSQSRTFLRLVQITMEHIGVESSSPTGGLTLGSDEIQSGSAAQIALATAQRVDMAGKIEASIKVGKRKYWRAIASGIHFHNINFENCLHVIHKDIITIWNFRDLHEILLSDAFRRRVMVIVEDLKDTDTVQSKVAAASAPAVLSKLWTNVVYKNGPEHVRCLMGYVVDLTLILQAMFQVSLQGQYEGTVSVDDVNEILYEFRSSEKKRIIHHAIRSFVQHSFARDYVVEMIQLLLKEIQMTQTDTKLNKDWPPLLSLLTILKFEVTANGMLVVNRIILDLVCKLLELPDFRSIVPGMHPPDVELLLDFILYLLQNDYLSTCGMQDANRKARRLMAKLISEANVIPQSLYITKVSFDTDHGPIGIGGHGRVFKGIYKGNNVALKMLDNFKGRKDLFQEFCKEALVWRSLKHHSILPLLGIFKTQKLHYLVSPLMPNGTLTEWRRIVKTKSQFLANIHRLILEVAEGVQYLHSEGVVHGDIKGDNVLIDSEFHCKIVDFGLTRHSDATATGSMAYTLNYAAPELFVGKCSECKKPQCSGCHEQREAPKKTMQSDVYAFGCLYYAIFFNSVPYEGESVYRIGWLVTNGERPQRLANPKMQDSLWELINDCWEFHASERPPMTLIVERVKLFIKSVQNKCISP